MAVDRQLAADVVHLLRHLPEFDAIYVRRHASGDQLAVPILNDRARAYAAGLLTTLDANERVQLVTSAATPGMGNAIDLFDDELRAAASRAEARRNKPAAVPTPAMPSVRHLLLVTSTPEDDLTALRSGGTAPFDATLAKSIEEADAATQTTIPDVVVIDVDLPRAIEFERDLCRLFPKFGIYDNLHWFSSSNGGVTNSRARILNALFDKAHLTVLGPFAGLRVLVADASDLLTRELIANIPELRPRTCNGWELLKQLRGAVPDVVIIGKPNDSDPIELFRAVRKSANVRVILALDDVAALERLRTKSPWFENSAGAPYLLARPIRPEDLARITRRPSA